mmetsp:Transcript_19693/g.39059  ORF Transcript_19693/g.39059 Transcript_19693/m.39059 type:complete len:283 (+) Transcript_19693:286-1134(+)
MGRPHGLAQCSPSWATVDRYLQRSRCYRGDAGFSQRPGHDHASPLAQCEASRHSLGRAPADGVDPRVPRAAGEARGRGLVQAKHGGRSSAGALLVGVPRSWPQACWGWVGSPSRRWHNRRCCCFCFLGRNCCCCCHRWRRRGGGKSGAGLSRPLGPHGRRCKASRHLPPRHRQHLRGVAGARLCARHGRLQREAAALRRAGRGFGHHHVERQAQHAPRENQRGGGGRGLARGARAVHLAAKPRERPAVAEVPAPVPPVCVLPALRRVAHRLRQSGLEATAVA